MSEHKVKITVELLGWVQEEVYEVSQKQDLPKILRHMADSYEESLESLCVDSFPEER